MVVNLGGDGFTEMVLFFFFLPKPQIVFDLTGNTNELTLGCRNLFLTQKKQPLLDSFPFLIEKPISGLKTHPVSS